MRYSLKRFVLDSIHICKIGSDHWIKILFILISTITLILSYDKLYTVLASEAQEDVKKTQTNHRPEIESIEVSFDQAKNDSELTVTPINVSDPNKDDILNMACNYQQKPVRKENLCLNFPQNAEAPYDNLVCLMKYDDSQKDTIYCRLHDGKAYSANVVMVNVPDYPTLDSDISQSELPDLTEEVEAPSNIQLPEEKKVEEVGGGEDIINELVNRINILEKKMGHLLEISDINTNLKKDIEDLNNKITMLEGYSSNKVIKDKLNEIEKKYLSLKANKGNYNQFQGKRGRRLVLQDFMDIWDLAYSAQERN